MIKLRPRSTREVEDFLCHKGYSAQAIQEAVAWARSVGWLDDALFARLWVRERLDRRPCSARLLRFELERKGVPDEAIAQALACVELDERELIRRLLEARLPRYRGQPPEARRRKLLGFLQRRGFSAGDAFAVLREFESEPR